MDKDKYKMVGIRVYSTDLPDGGFLIKFMGEIDTDTLISIIADENFNEFEWAAKLKDMLIGNNIPYIMCEVDKFDEMVMPKLNSRKEEERDTNLVRDKFDIYIELFNGKEKEREEEYTSQYVYIYSDEWNQAKSVMHIAGIEKGTDENSDRFWDETYVLSLKYPSDSTQNTIPKYRLDSKIASQDEKRCVPYYDRYIILKYIDEIDNCDDLRDYVESETEKRAKANAEKLKENKA